MFHTHSFGASYTEIASAKSQATSAEQKARNAAIEIGKLAARLDSMALTSQAMWELLREKTDLTDDDLRQRMQEVDLRDGTADGRLKPVVADCQNCRRPVNSRRPACIYCGHEIQPEHVFDQ